MAGKTITRKSLGRSAAIGDLYDATTDSFCEKSIFGELFNSEMEVKTTGHAVMLTQSIYNDENVFNNFMKYDVEPELAVSVLCGLVPFSSLKESVTGTSLVASLSFTYKTKTDRLDMEQSHIKRLINAKNVVESNATHVVVGIDWGSFNVLSIIGSEDEGHNAEGLKEYLQSIIPIISTGAVNTTTESKYTLHFESDLVNAGDVVPETIDCVVSFIKNIPKRFENEQNGQQKCLSFVLFPLASLGKVAYFDFTNFAVQPIESKVICALGDVVTKIFDATTKLQVIETLTDSNESYVPNKIRKIVKMKKAIIDKTMKNIADSLVKVRKGICTTFEFQFIEETFHESSTVLDQFFSEIQPFVERIHFMNHVTNLGAFYIGGSSSFEEARRKIKPNDEFYVLFYVYKQDDEITSENMGLFNEILKGKVACFVADLGMQPDLAVKEGVPEGIRICHFIQNGYKDVDVYKTFKVDREFNLIRSICKMQPVANKPRKRALIYLVCPGSLHGECSNEKQQWMCEKCKSTVEYGFDEMFYCDCGKEFLNTCEFRCRDVNHGNNFIAFDTHILKSKLNEIEIVPEVNILVLGETGVGKSTWINAIANYLTFPTLKEATDVNEILCLVPTKFVLLDENCKERVVSIGSSKNEETRAGQACTQYPTSHLVTIGNERIRIIDTPGIGDPRGVEQDKINVDNILRFVSGLEEIHGICLLLKPNNARLTTFFKFCVKEILAHLHKSSVHNLLFCFTNTRSTFYKPGDTYPALKELLAEINANLSKKSRGKACEIVLASETMFCLDNEAFRFLCARRNNIDFTPEDFQNFSLSWDKSAVETQRMLNFIKCRKPHKVNDTMSINDARNTILTLARPMAKISDNIAANIRVAENQKKFTETLDDEKLKLEKNRLVQQIQITTVQIDYPKTVCTNSHCVEVRLIPGTSQNMIIYRTVCHDHCYLKGVNVETVGAPELQRCSAMNGIRCNRCGCPWQSHMHITYNFEESMVTVPNVSVEKMIKENVAAKLVKEQMILTLEQTIEQYRLEQNEILEVSSQFGSLLQQHAIIPYNDAFESHVRHELRLASAEASISPDLAKKKDDLERLLNEYLEKKRLLDDAMVKNVNADITVDNVDALKDQLMNLKLTGESFQNCFQTAANAQSHSFDYVERPINIHKRNRSHFKKTFSYIKSKASRFFTYYSY
ncbi:uncharacterized protein LOC119066418 [Bradysia coprophila]|uniref:uncharacterized protein LOC119066418 n=1 Tax=Bradysia coprophila TaxID=38358 RepID=UPI00187D942C|nr:uncharacterized protein LOC119066418 [Bradysia coprophila]